MILIGIKQRVRRSIIHWLFLMTF